jgi:hypothetical protein
MGILAKGEDVLDERFFVRKGDFDFALLMSSCLRFNGIALVTMVRIHTELGQNERHRLILKCDRAPSGFESTTPLKFSYALDDAMIWTRTRKTCRRGWNTRIKRLVCH